MILHIKLIPNKNKRIVPIKYEYFFNILLTYFPSVNPKKVKEKLHIENIVDDNNILFVIAFNPIPIVKLSNDTPNAKRNIPNFVKEISLFDGLIYSINICVDINNNIIPSSKSVFIFTFFVIWYDKYNPNSGIIK